MIVSLTTIRTEASQFIESWQLSLKKLDKLFHCLKLKTNMFNLTFVCNFLVLQHKIIQLYKSHSLQNSPSFLRILKYDVLM